MASHKLCLRASVFVISPGETTIINHFIGQAWITCVILKQLLLCSVCLYEPISYVFDNFMLDTCCLLVFFLFYYYFFFAKKTAKMTNYW